MKLLIPALALLSTSAMAADFKFNAEGRFDYINATVKHENTTAANAYEEKTAGFRSNVLRLNALATINEDLSFRFRYRFSTVGTAASPNRDLTWSNVDYFNIDHKTEWFTARIGKFATSEMAGREFFMSATDFPITMASNSTIGNSLYQYSADNSGAYNSANADMGLYRTGVSLMFKQIEGQTFTVNVSEPMKSIGVNGTPATNTTGVDGAGAGNSSTNTALAYGFYYNGSFMNKLVQPTFGYTLAKLNPEVNAATPANNTVESTFKLLAVGVRSEVANFVIDLDFKQYKRPNYAVVGATSNEDKVTSIWTNVAYNWENLTPFVNYINDKYEKAAAATSNYKRNAVSVGLQVKPFKDSNFRYHVAYTSDVKKIDAIAAATETKVSANTVAAGIKFDI